MMKRVVYFSMLGVGILCVLVAFFFMALPDSPFIRFSISDFALYLLLAVGVVLGGAGLLLSHNTLKSDFEGMTTDDLQHAKLVMGAIGLLSLLIVVLNNLR